MSKQGKVYIGAVLVTATCLLVLPWMSWRMPQPIPLTCCIGIAMLAAVLKVRFPGMQSSLSASFVVLLAEIPFLDLGTTLAMSAIVALVQCLWKPKTKPKLIQIAFNVATLVISTSFAFAVVRGLPAAEIPALILAATVYFLVNTGLVCGVLVLLKGDALFSLWRRCHLWAAPYYTAGAVIAGLVVVSRRLYGWEYSLLIYPTLYLIYWYFDGHINTMTLQVVEERRAA